MPTTPLKFRRADPVDKEAIQRISADAYVPAYTAVLGAIPKPATEDYRTRIEKGEVWILEVEGEPTGVAVLEDAPVSLAGSPTFVLDRVSQDYARCLNLRVRRR